MDFQQCSCNGSQKAATAEEQRAKDEVLRENVMNKTVQLIYIEGIIPEENLELLRSKLGNHDIGFEWHDMSGAPQAAISDFLAPIILSLPSDVVQAYILGLANSVSYDLLKLSILEIWHNITGKKYNKITSNNIQEIEASFDLNVDTPGKTKFKFKLAGNISDNLKEKCIDNAFQLIESKSYPENHTEYICSYDTDNEQWEKLEQFEFIKKYIIPKNG